MQFFNKVLHSRSVGQHLLFWLVAYLIRTAQLGTYQEERDPLFHEIITNAFQILFAMLQAYFVSYRILPRIFINRNYLLIIPELIVGLYVIAVISRITVIYLVEPIVRTPPFDQESIIEIMTDLDRLVMYFIQTFSIAIIFIFFKLFKDQYLIRERALGLEKQKVEIELAALKSQLNPHFLFNTLNNIYSLSIANSPSTSEAIAGLSAMLDHVLYRSHDRFVPLEQEINFIRNYVSLEQLRYGKELDVKLVADDIANGTVAPLILPSLVENAFKHVGVNSQNEQFVTITLSRQQQQLKFLVVNTYAAHEQSDNENGIGLKNIRQQLSLIYQQNYNFQTIKQEGIFVAQLEIDII